MLSTTEVLAPVYFILGGNKSGEVRELLTVIINITKVISCRKTATLRNLQFERVNQ